MTANLLNEEVAQRFWSRVVKTQTCWLWDGPLDNGYGRFWFNRKTLLCHRVAYEMLIGPIPLGMALDHLCRNRSCVNPEHLEIVTLGENVLRGIGRSAVNARKTHCKNGHEFDAENTYFRKEGNRECIPCQRASQALWYARKKVTV